MGRGEGGGGGTHERGRAAEGGSTPVSSVVEADALPRAGNQRRDLGFGKRQRSASAMHVLLVCMTLTHCVCVSFLPCAEFAAVACRHRHAA